MKRTITFVLGLTTAAFFILHLSTRKTAEHSDENAASVESVALSQPAPEVSPPTSPPLEVKRPKRTVFQRIADNDTNVFKLSSEQVQQFLARNRTNADSLLTAFNITHDKEF